MPKDREQQTPVEPEDRENLERHRGQGSAGTGRDLLPGEVGGPPERIELTSSAFDHGETIPQQYSRDGGNVSPPLEWSGVPDETAELALICEDPDAPSGTFVHWVLTGLDPALEGLDEGVTPPGAIVGANGFGDTGWGGPAPPPGHGPHRYVFRLFALSEPADVPPGSTARDLRVAMADKQLAEGQLVGVYER